MPPVERKFCRFEAPDIRDEQYLIRRAKPTRAYRNWSSGGWHGDQSDEPSCFPPDTPVVLADGSEKTISKICPGEMVLTHTGKAKMVTASFARRYVGMIAKIKLRGRCDRIRATPDHQFLTTTFANVERQSVVVQKQKTKIWSKEVRDCVSCARESRTRVWQGTVEWGVYCSNECKLKHKKERRKKTGRTNRLEPVWTSWKPASDLNVKVKGHAGDYLQSPCKTPMRTEMLTIDVLDLIPDAMVNPKTGLVRIPLTRTTAEIPRFIEVNKDFGELVGLYLAEGSTQKTKCSDVCLSFNISELNTLAKRASDLLASVFGIETYLSLRKANNVVNVRGYSSVAARLLGELCGYGSSKKRFHSSMWNWPTEALESVWSGFSDGDGYTRNKNENSTEEVLTTVSDRLARDLWRLGVQLGYRPTWRSRQQKPSHGVKTRKRCHRISRYTGTGSPSLPSDDCFLYAAVEDIDFEPYDGLVYNLEVEDDHSYIANNVVAHNCVGFGWSHWLHSSPIRQWLDPSGLYQIAQHYDEWDGTEYDGTSVRAGAKVLQMLGAIGEYRWTWNASHVADHVLAVGPVVVGVDWYVGMSLPNEAGLMSIDGKLEGGHCVCLTGYNSRNELFRVKNSWGTNWGKSGYGYLSLADLQVLLADGGEACVGIETELKR